jgi:hypothetical protein
MTKLQAESVRRLIVSHSVAWSFGFRSHENFIQVMLSSMNTIADIQTLYARLGERDYEAVMSYLADDVVSRWPSTNETGPSRKRGGG